ncbi:GNAT family N-acetyltransferase [Vagococcus entomophilus]|uniref:N-acetyltransferase domain-containing protein n=1 Tax=Vagococcus entomophilus TaxID=1160095 RepID=A0A430AFE3_9ENTE|nr:GNAT family N-acetyltransferase [Vagococcus entomophilus]RSU06441.1 hypothetical protein CBF30_09305 [Vagococcus entomophilus]
MEHLFPRSNRLIFSAWSEQDNELADKIWGSEKVTKLICAKGYFTKNEISERLQKEISYNKAYGVQYWKVCEKDTGAFIGCCGLHPYEKEPLIYELGFHLHENFWGKGYGLEMAEAVIQFGTKYLQCHKYFAGHHPDNGYSKALLEKLGFTYFRKEYYAPTGRLHPSYYLIK